MKRALATLVVTGLCTAYILWKIDVGHTVHVLVHGHIGWWLLSLAIIFAWVFSGDTSRRLLYPVIPLAIF